MPNSIIAAAVEASLRAREAANRAAQVLADVQAAAAHLRGRSAALQAERTGIIQARKRGADEPDHGARLALIGADLDGLAEMQAEADAKVARAAAEAQEARHAAAVAEQAIQRATDAELLARLTAHATKLDGLLLETVRAINATQTSLSRHGVVWAPSLEMAYEIRKLDLMRGSLR